MDTPMRAIEHAVLAVMAAGGDDRIAARSHISCAQEQSRMTARRERQIVEIASLVVAGDPVRAAGLAYEHLVEFPDDAELLAHITPRRT